MATAVQSRQGVEVAKLLQGMLYELIGLSLYAKQAHWNVTGPFFGSLHAFFDQLTDSARAHYDEVAERMLALGVAADGRPSSVAQAADLGRPEFPQGHLDGQDAVKLVLFRLQSATRHMHEGLEELGSLDPVTQDLILGVLESLEKQAWMLKAQVA